MIIDNTEYNGIFLYKAGVTYTVGDIVIHPEGGKNVLYRVLAQTSQEPYSKSMFYEEYACGSSIKDIGTYDNEEHINKLVSCSVMDEVMKRLTHGVNAAQARSKMYRLESIQNTESISYTLDSIVRNKQDRASGSSFVFATADMPVPITEIDVFVTYAPHGSSGAAGYIYRQEMVRLIPSSNRNVNLYEYEDLSCNITGSDSSYTITISPVSGKVEPGTLRIERIEGLSKPTATNG